MIGAKFEGFESLSMALIRCVARLHQPSDLPPGGSPIVLPAVGGSLSALYLALIEAAFV